MTNSNRLLSFLVLLVPLFVASWQPSTPTRHQQRRHQFTLFVNRRDVMKDIFTTTGGIAATTAGGVLLVPPKPAHAETTTTQPPPPIDQIGTMGSQTPLSKTSSASSTTDVGAFIGENTQF